MHNAALHIAYRPRTLADLVGQPYIQTALSNAIRHQQIAPAYLFAGVRGTGKTSTARILAKSLNCLSDNQPTVVPCGHCESCRQIEAGNSFDVTEIDAASNSSVHEARELVERVPLAPVYGRYRVFILDEVHCLTVNAFNALLKCIEEPPAHAVFVFCTTELHKVLPTIISRCQRFDFRALSVQTIASHLRHVAEAEAMTIGGEALMAIARLSEGGMRDALQLLSQARLLDGEVTATQIVEMVGGIGEPELLTILQAIVNSNVLQLLQVARELIDGGRSPRLLLASLLQVYRDLLILKSAPESAQSLLAGAMSYKHLRTLASKWSYDTIYTALNQLQKAELQLRQSTNASVWAEVCLLGLVPGLVIDPIATTTVTTTAPIGKNGISNHRSSSGKISNGKRHNGTATAIELDLKTVWLQVVETAKPNVRKTLEQAELRSLNEQGGAVIAVSRDLMDKFETNADRVARMLQKAANLSAAPSIQFEEK